MIKKILISLAVLVGIIGLLGIVAPKEFTVERDITIQKPKAFVFDQLRFFRNHTAWSPWEKKDPQMIKEFKGTDGTVGFVGSWSGNKEVGVGEQEITNIVEGEKIETELRFKEPFENKASAYFKTEAVGENQTKVTWGMKGASPFPFNVFCLLFNMKKQLGDEFSGGLNSLKTHLESTP